MNVFSHLLLIDLKRNLEIVDVHDLPEHGMGRQATLEENTLTLMIRKNTVYLCTTVHILDAGARFA